MILLLLIGLMTVVGAIVGGGFWALVGLATGIIFALGVLLWPDPY